MDYLNPLERNKRRREEEHSQRECHPKRACRDMVGCIPVQCDVLIDSPMDSWDTQIVHQNGASPNHHTTVADMAQHSCPRCMAGEPGHINHIMQKY